MSCPWSPPAPPQGAPPGTIWGAEKEEITLVSLTTILPILVIKESSISETLEVILNSNCVKSCVLDFECEDDDGCLEPEGCGFFYLFDSKDFRFSKSIVIDP